jgi:hypothetical protein
MRRLSSAGADASTRLARGAGFLFSLLIAGCQNAGNDHSTPAGPEAEPDAMVTLDFAVPPTIDELSALESAHDLRIEEIRIEHPELTSGFRLDGRDLGIAREEFLKEHAKFLDYMATHQEHQTAALRQRVRALRAELDAGNARVTAIVVPASAVGVSIPGAKLRDETVTPEEAVQPFKPDDATPTPESSYHEPWAPYAGSSEINQSFSRQWFIFNNTGAFGFAKGYEHEVLITNKSYVDFSGYWSTNMPYNYNDCGNDGDPVDNFAIGCKIGWGLSNYAWYFTYHGFRAYMSTTSSAKVQGARTYPGFPTCYYCWCFSSDAHTYPYIRLSSLPTGPATWQY